MNKKLIIITSALGLVSFAGAFAFSWFAKPSPTDIAADPNQPLQPFAESKIKPPQPKSETIHATETITAETTKS